MRRQPQLPALQPRRFHQVFNHHVHALRRAGNRVQAGLRRAIDLRLLAELCQHLLVPEDDGERHAQVMGHHMQEGALLLAARVLVGDIREGEDGAQ
ncbi:MAG: hypothetical protein BWY76_03356 [bacterium ADurb.Bin429]|nr:MAG: hypothetical protein BWY76_03356 [bacterium ADurb.Bin429]